MDGWEGRKEMCMHKSNDYVSLSLHNDNNYYNFSISHTHRCVRVYVCDLRRRYASVQVLNYTQHHLEKNYVK